jgi:hypothetical protein
MHNELSIREKNINLFIRLAGVLALISVLCLAILFSNPFRFLFPPVPISSEMKLFTLEQDKIEFGFPENWFANLTPQGNHGDLEVIAIIVAPVQNFQSVIVARKSFVGATISDVAEWGTSRIKARIPHYKLDSLIDYKSQLFAGSVREYVAYSSSPIDTRNARCKDLYFLHDQNGYAFSFCAKESDWAKVLPLFDKIIASIQFLEK